jgi:hypothetical protein
MTLNILKIIPGIILLCILQPALAGPKIDTVYFQDGDRITGEVKELSYNRLRLSTDNGGTISIEWNKVDSVVFLNTLRIVLDDGKIYYGQVHSGTDAGTGTIRPIGGGDIYIYLVRIVSLTPVEERVIDRLNGLLSSGFSYVKATQVIQFAVNASLDYDAARNHVGLFYDGNMSNDPINLFNQRQKGGANYKRYLPKNWFVIGQWTAETNTELELDLRTGFAVGGGNSLINTNRMRLDAGAGVQFNREQSLDLHSFNLESVFIGDYYIYIFEAPDINFDIKASLIPSLSDFGRIRTELNSNLRWEVLNDFFLKWTFYYSFDSRPLTEDASKTDWAVTMLGIEYSL